MFYIKIQRHNNMPPRDAELPSHVTYRTKHRRGGYYPPVCLAPWGEVDFCRRRKDGEGLT